MNRSPKDRKAGSASVAESPPKPQPDPQPDPQPESQPEQGGFLGRWSKRKREQQSLEADTANPSDTDALPATETLDSDQSTPGDEPASHSEPTTEVVLTDEDMPDIETLSADSDYSPFFSEGVSKELRNLALKRLFFSGKFNIRDGLDDYDDDFTKFEPLGNTVTSDMKFHERRKEKARLAKLEEERLEQEKLDQEKLQQGEAEEDQDDESSVTEDDREGQVDSSENDADEEVTPADDASEELLRQAVQHAHLADPVFTEIPSADAVTAQPKLKRKMPGSEANADQELHENQDLHEDRLLEDGREKNIREEESTENDNQSRQT